MNTEQLKELKAKAYDALALIEKHQNEIKKIEDVLKKINQEIAEEYQKNNEGDNG